MYRVDFRTFRNFYTLQKFYINCLATFAHCEFLLGDFGIVLLKGNDTHYVEGGAGLFPGDRLIEVNGENVEASTDQHIAQLISVSSTDQHIAQLISVSSTDQHIAQLISVSFVL